jgi:peptidylprolyl isomerase
MPEAKQGDVVSVHYTGKLDDGTVFDSTSEDRPFEFTLGEGKVIPGFESAVSGMKIGESKTVTVKPDDAYGKRRDDLVVQVDRKVVPENLDLEVGQRLQMHRADGESVPVTVVDISEERVTLDANHPLAGRDLIFEIELVKVA